MSLGGTAPSYTHTHLHTYYIHKQSYYRACASQMIMKNGFEIIRAKYSRIDSIQKIAILADCGCVGEWESTFPGFLSKMFNLHLPDIFFIIGDLSSRGRNSRYKKLLHYLKKHPVKYIAVPGNNDKPLLNFFRYFGRMRKIADIGKWRFIFLNTSDSSFSWLQKRWLNKHIKPNTIILSHYPPKIDQWRFYSLPDKPSSQLLDAISENRENIKAAFFGHIHGYSEQMYKGVKMIVTGGSARSRAIRNNRYNEETPLEMIIFDVKTGAISVETE